MTPEDIPGDAGPVRAQVGGQVRAQVGGQVRAQVGGQVCGGCRRPVEWDGVRGGWEHAEIADALLCAMLFTGAPVIIEEDENA